MYGKSTALRGERARKTHTYHFYIILKDPLFFVQAHKHMGDASKNLTTLRLLHYPPLVHETPIKPGQLRCGEHVDYGSVTLLFQDSNGGLQVL